MAPEPVVATYSIVACDRDVGQWGVAVQSKFLAVGSVVPWAEPHVGAIATQSYANPRYGPDGLALLREGKSAQEAIDALTSADDDQERPVAELRRIYGLHRELFGTTPPEEWVEVDSALSNELGERLAQLGFEGELGRAFGEWAGSANLEERVNGIQRIDPVVL